MGMAFTEQPVRERPVHHRDSSVPDVVRGIAISLWPYIVPRHYTLWDAASSPSTQSFLLIGVLVLLPVILMYTAWSYWVFRGKVRADIGYH